MNKNLHTIFLLVLSIFLIVSCQKESDIEVNSSKAANYIFDTFNLSVIENTLVFEDEQELYKCFDYLVELGHENFNTFEESINYVSYRQLFIHIEDKPDYYEDLYFTILNPEGKVVVGDYLLQDCPEENNIIVYKIDCDYTNIKTFSVPDMIVSRDQDVFEAIRGEIPMKSSSRPQCNTNSQEATISDFRVDIKIKTQFNNGIVKFFKARISRPWCIGCGLTLLVTNRSVETSFCLLDKNGDGASEQRLNDIYLSKSSTGTSAEIYQPLSFRPTDYRFYVDYMVIQEAPWFNQTYNGDISCGPSEQSY